MLNFHFCNFTETCYLLQVLINYMSKKKKFSPTRKKSTPKKIIHQNSDLENKVLNYIQSKSKSGIKSNQVFDKFLKKETAEKIEEVLSNLEQARKINFINQGKIVATDQKNYSSQEHEGTVDLAASGVGYVKVEGFEKDIFIPRKHTKNAIGGDRVKVQLTSAKKTKPEGIIIEILKRKQEDFICHFEASDSFGFAVPINGKVPFDIFIPEHNQKEAKAGDLVLIRVIDWNEATSKNPVGKVVEILSDLSDNEVEMRNILLENGFNPIFPGPVMDEVERIEEQIPLEVINQRLDYRDVLTITIDPEDAKDFDDAISIKTLDNGLKQIGVHIADVSHYVQPNSEIDKEAQLRATSVYLPDRVCPMLPEKLSNMVCSLRPNEDKCTFSVLFDVNEKLEIVNYTFAKTVTNSNRRFIYEEVQEIIEAREGEYAEEIHYLVLLARKLREKRFKNGAINFESEEVRFRFDENAVPIEAFIKERKEANLLVEDFMLLANTTVAKYFSKLEIKNKNLAGVYRVHDTPDEGKLEQLASIARKFGYDFKFEDSNQIRSALNNLMEILKGKPAMNVLSSLAVRSMAKAEYTTKNIGHYGLAFEYYTHFTSPIRRYPDVLVHRLLIEKMMKQKPFYTGEELEELCQQSSMMERKAQSAEREGIKYKQVEFLQDKIGQEFEGVISGVISRGLFVELTANKCEGFASLSEFDDDFIYEEELIRLVGRTTKLIFQIGDKVKVSILKADLKEKKIEFDVLEKLEV